jgi:hypothetical protein
MARRVERFLAGGVATGRVLVAAGQALTHGDEVKTGYPARQSRVRVPGSHATASPPH